MKQKTEKLQNKPQFSKLIILSVVILFIATLIHCFTKDSIDTTTLVTELTVTGGLASSAIIFYYRKAQLENCALIRLDHMKQIAGVEYEYYEKRLRLKKELGVIDEEGSVTHDWATESITEDINYLNTKLEEASEDVEAVG